MVKVNNFLSIYFFRLFFPVPLNLTHQFNSTQFEASTASYSTAVHNSIVVKYAPCRIVQRREVFLIQVVDVLRQLLLDLLGKTLDHGDLAISGKLRWGKVEQGYYYMFTRLSAWK